MEVELLYLYKDIKNPAVKYILSHKKVLGIPYRSVTTLCNCYQVL